VTVTLTLTRALTLTLTLTLALTPFTGEISTMFKDAVPIGFKRCDPQRSLESDTKLQAQVCYVTSGANQQPTTTFHH
jgi:hypothetical protein